MKRLVFVMLMVLCSSFVAAEVCKDPTECPDIFHASNPGAFNYETGDYTSITNYNLLDWTKVPDDRMREIPYAALDFSKISVSQIASLTATQKTHVTADQIENHLDKLGDLTQFAHAPTAIKKRYDVDIDPLKGLGKGALIKGDVLSSTYGKKESIDLVNKKGWKIRVSHEDGSIRVDEGTILVDETLITATDSFSIPNKILFQRKDGTIIDVEGVSVKNSQLYVKQGDIARIGGYKIIATSGNINLVTKRPSLLDKSSYVLISDSEFSIHTKNKDSLIVDVEPGNSFFGLRKKEYTIDANGNPIKNKFTLVADDRASLIFTVEGGDRVDAYSRLADGKVPTISVKNNGGTTKVETGRMVFDYDKKGFMYITKVDAFSDTAVSFQNPQPPYDMSFANSVAFELQAPLGASLGTLKTSSSNRYVYEYKGKPLYTNAKGLRISNLREPNLMKTIDDLHVKYPLMKFEERGKQYEITANAAQVADEWLCVKPACTQMKSRLHEYVPKILFYPGDVAAAIDGFALGERTIDPSTAKPDEHRKITVLDILDHEFDHSFDHKVNTQEQFLPGTGKRLHELYDEEATKHINALFSDKNFLKLDTELEASAKAYSLNIYKNPLTTAKTLQDKGETLAAIDQALQDGENEARKRLEKNPNNNAAKIQLRSLRILRTEFNQRILQKTGLLPYAFHTDAPPGNLGGENFLEISAVYGEMTGVDAKKNKRLAQIEYDRVMATQPPKWISDRAQKRCSAILGSTCKPCVIYTRTCTKP